jgi:hypothetical protein
MLKELEDLYEECKVEGWDGYGALPIQQETYVNSIALLNYLISNNLTPSSIDAECDGHITFEWYKHPRFILSVSIETTLHYAALFNEESIKGQELFEGNLSQTLLNIIQRFN